MVTPEAPQNYAVRSLPLLLILFREIIVAYADNYMKPQMHCVVRIQSFTLRGGGNFSSEITIFFVDHLFPISEPVDRFPQTLAWILRHL